MKLDAQHIIAAIALLSAGYMLAKRQAPASGQNDVATAADWWTYAGNWS